MFRNICLYLLLLSLPALAQSGYQPAPDSTISTTRPTISVTFANPVRNVQITVDGQDFSSQARLAGATVTLNIPYDIDKGQHVVVAEGLNFLGLKERASWKFFIAQNQTGPARTPDGYGPYPGATVETARPIITVDFAEPITTARLRMDSADVSNQIRIQGKRLIWEPVFDLAPGRHQGQVEATGQSGQAFSGAWLFDVRRPAPVATPTPGNNALLNLAPAPGARLYAQSGGSRPTISADFPQPVNNPRMLVDGVDVSGQAQRTASRISWTPAYDLQVAQHTVQVDGVSTTGQAVSGSWTFVIENVNNGGNNGNSGNRPGGGARVTLDAPTTGQMVGKVVDVQGRAPANSRVRVQLRDPSNGRTESFRGKADRAGYYSVPASTQWAAQGAVLELIVEVSEGRNSPPMGSAGPIMIRRR